LNRVAAYAADGAIGTNGHAHAGPSLKRMLDALAAGRRTFLVEDAVVAAWLVDAGVAAIVVDGDTGVDVDQCRDHLSLRPAAVLVGSDRAGVANANRIARAASAYCSDVRVLRLDRLPDDPRDLYAMADAADRFKPGPPTIGELVALHPALRPPLVEGLLREGETMNVIAPPKTGKSWLVNALALSVAVGVPWLGRFATRAGRVLVLDNELHRETSADRIPHVARAMGIAPARYADRVCVENLRGRLRDLFGMRDYFDALEPGQFAAVILDAFYRFLPVGANENDNGTVAGLYNEIDRTADRLGCAFVLIHHSSKGNQSGKAVTDVGAGAGAQSRAADTHIALRPHREPGAVVMDAAVRSSPPFDPIVLRWSFPLWRLDDQGLDPSDLRPERNNGGRPPKGKDDATDARPGKRVWTPAEFAAQFVTSSAQSAAAIFCETEAAGISGRAAKQLLEAAEEKGLIFRWPGGKKQPDRYANRAEDLGDTTRGKGQ
jgi:hypothetical protein